MFSIVDRLGEIGVGLLIFLENLIPPIPSEAILPLAGFRARTGALNVWLVWPAATLGSVLGALVLYGVGAWLGYDRLHALAGKRWFFITSQKDLDRGEKIFTKHGGKMVLFGRCVPLIRSVVSIPAGHRPHAAAPLPAAHRDRQRRVERDLHRAGLDPRRQLGPRAGLARAR